MNSAKAALIAILISPSMPIAALGGNLIAVSAPSARPTAGDREDWPAPGGDGSGAYYSALNQIDKSNASELGFAWEYRLGTRRGLEATPVVIDGTLYTSGNWGLVYALDAKSGREKWTYNPQVDGRWGRSACCDVVNRGVAVSEKRVYVASLDGYLHALDATTGTRIWKVDALPGRMVSPFQYPITGAPVIAGELVVIGSGGADFKGARGFVSAFDRSTGALRWRFYTVPRDPHAGPQDQPHLDSAVKTWDAHYDWSTGGGGSVWDGISYDPELHLVFIGTANPSPYAIGKDSWSGDQLYTNSIIAIHEQTGKLAWYYQEVPGDGWDYDATQKMVLTELQIGGRPQKVLIQAAKNGYLYTLDRATGKLVSAHQFTRVNWTLGLDPKTHRPIRNPNADYTRSPALVLPGTTGAHSWQPMSYSPLTRLVYIPVIDAPMVYIETARRPAGLIEGNYTVAGIWPEDYMPADMTGLFGSLPPLEELARRASDANPKSRGILRAIDIADGRVAWEQPGIDMWDGGILSTGGNLVIRGDVAGHLNIYAADDGKLLKVINVGTAMMAAPMTYSIDGEQYVAVMAGYGGGNLFVPYPEKSAARRYENVGRVVAFKLQGGAVPKPAPVVVGPFPKPPPREGSRDTIARGEILYSRFCSRCHTFGQALLPDLRRLSSATHQLFYEIVLHGVYQGNGMARWDDVLSPPDAEAIHAYLIDQSWIAYNAQ